MSRISSLSLSSSDLPPTTITTAKTTNKRQTTIKTATTTAEEENEAFDNIQRSSSSSSLLGLTQKLFHAFKQAISSMFVCRLLTNLISVSRTTTTNVKTNNSNQQQQQYWWWSSKSSSSNHHNHGSSSFSFLSSSNSSSYDINLFESSSNLSNDSVFVEKNNTNHHHHNDSSSSSKIQTFATSSLAQEANEFSSSFSKTKTLIGERLNYSEKDEKKKKSKSSSSTKLSRAFDYYKSICNYYNKDSTRLSTKDKFSFDMEHIHHPDDDGDGNSAVDISNPQQQQNDLLARQKRFKITEKQLTYLKHKIVSLSIILFV